MAVHFADGDGSDAARHLCLGVVEGGAVYAVAGHFALAVGADSVDTAPTNDDAGHRHRWLQRSVKYR